MSDHSIFVLASLFTADDLSTCRYFGLPIESGSVTIDISSTSRRSMEMTLVDDDIRFADALGRLTPTEPGDLLTPYGTVVLIQYGVSFPGFVSFFGNNIMFINLGYFWIDTVNPVGDGRISITGLDFSYPVSVAEFTTPYIIPAGTLATQAITDGIATRVPAGIASLAPTVTPSAEVAPLSVLDINQDPWQQFVRMAETIGYEMYFGASGPLVLLPKVDPTTTPVQYSFVDGINGIVARQRRLDANPGYNGIVGTSEATTLAAPLRSEIWDDNSSSPTYYKGRYGQRPKFVSYPYAATQAQLDAAVAADLVRVLGGTEQVELAVLPDPTLDVEDVFGLRCPRLRMDGVYQIRRIVIPFKSDEAMAISATRVRVGL